MNSIKTLLFAALLMLAAGSALADDIGPSPLTESDNRIRELTYSDNDVYTITTKYGYQTNILFGKGEEIQTISVGDRSLWQLIPAGNRLFIRPMAYSIETNMTLITNKRSYQFDLKSLPDDKSGGNIYVARFVYPENNGMQVRPSHMQRTMPLPQPTPAPMPPAAQMNYAPPLSPQASLPAPAPAQGGMNYNYTYTGPDAAAPLQAYDNGKSTFFQYSNNQSPPAVYVIDANGKPQPVSYNVENNTIVVDKVAGEWQLEESNATVHLYNEMLNPE